MDRPASGLRMVVRCAVLAVAQTGIESQSARGLLFRVDATDSRIYLNTFDLFTPGNAGRSKTMELTTEQLGTVLFRADHESRRRAKRYLRDHGGEGVGAELDRILALARADGQAVRQCNEMVARRHHQQSQAVQEADRAEAERRANIVRHAARADWGPLSQLVGWDDDGWQDVVCSTGGSYTAEQHEVLDCFSHMVQPPAVEAELLKGNIADVEFDQGLDRAYQTTVHAVASAWLDANAAVAVRELEARAKADGRFTVMRYYRKTMSPDGGMYSFDDRDDAVSLLTMWGDHSTSSYAVTLIDNDEVPA